MILRVSLWLVVQMGAK